MWGSPGTDTDSGSGTQNSSGATTQETTTEQHDASGNEGHNDGGGNDTSGSGGSGWPNPEDYPAPDDGSGNPISFISVVGMPTQAALKAIAARSNAPGVFSITMIDAKGASLRQPDASSHVFGHDVSILQHVGDLVGTKLSVSNAMQHAISDLSKNVHGIGNGVDRRTTPIVGAGIAGR